MNIKLHTPLSLKNGSGIATLKQLLLSVVATTISIILTFGTAGWLESRKKEAAKREMVMAILYDLDTSLKEIERVDSLFRASFEKQLQVAENPQLIKENPFFFVQLMPELQYMETVEQIFSSNIETINTIGNVFFAENVSRLYFLRKQYKESVVDSFRQDFLNETIREYDGAVAIDFQTPIIFGGTMLIEMKDKLASCKQMMNVSDADLAVYNEKRNEKAQLAADSLSTSLNEEIMRNSQRLDDAVKKGKEKLK